MSYNSILKSFLIIEKNICEDTTEKPQLRSPVCGFLLFWFLIAIERFALFHHSVFDYMCVNGNSTCEFHLELLRN